MSMQNKNNTVAVAVIGGGAAGLLAAGTALEAGATVSLFERNEKVGRKLAITGKGRCNLTNNCEPNEFLSNVISNPKFLFAALRGFTPTDTMALFERLGVPLKTERGRRVFPQSDRAYDIVDALRRYASGADTVNEKVLSLKRDEESFIIETVSGEYRAERVIIATGGKSYPLTGSDGDGYRFAASFGHTVTQLSPSLVPIEAKGDTCSRLMGLSLKNVALKIVRGGKTVFEDFGEMLFTHFGLSGPMILSASSHMRGIPPAECEAVIDMKPALDAKTLDARLISDFTKYRNKDFDNALSDLLPSKIIPVVIERSGIDGRKKVNSVTREERAALLTVIKGFAVPLSGFRPLSEAVVTAGGVAVGEINPRTMESKLVPGLFFAGEIIDVDAYTGGYNLQIAFSTGAAAGRAAAAE